MSNPSLLRTYPANNDSGIPTGSSIVLDFDMGVDPLSIKSYVVLYGNDFDQTSGAESQLYVDKDTGNNPFFLRSPGFKGPVDLKYRIVYYDIDTGLDIDLTANERIDEIAHGVAGAGSRVYITPTSGELAPSVEYTLVVLGDPSSLNTGISSRTVYDVAADPANHSATGLVYVTGGYTGGETTLTIQITDSGDIGTAKYEYWLGSDSAHATKDKLSSRKYRMLDRGLQIRFSGIGFVSGDTFTVSLEGAARMTTSTKVVFTTNDGTYTAAPDSPSTPATSSPPSTVLPPEPGASTALTNLQVEAMNPPDGAFNVPNKTRKIQVMFSNNLDASTISNATVRVFKYPVLGWWQGQPEPVELAKRLTVSGQFLTIDI